MTAVALSPRLTLVRQIGRGAMGEIWLADDSVLACRVAVKLVAGHLRLDARTLERFQHEARGAARVASPHVVRVLDHGVAEGRPYIVMELLEGEDLGAHLQRVGLLAPAECARIVGQACRGLASVHGAGLVHRDVKPDNLFLVDDGAESFVKLLDFGLAAEVRARVTAASGGSIVGTPCYMSPEHVEGMRSLVPQSDMWSLGAVAYEALTGELPFDGDGLISLAIAIADARFVPPSSHRPELPRALDEFFLRAFAPAPSDCFEDATAMALAFTRAVSLTAGIVSERAPARVHDAPSSAPAAPLRRRSPVASRRVTALVVAALSIVVASTLRLVWPEPSGAAPPLRESTSATGSILTSPAPSASVADAPAVASASASSSGPPTGEPLLAALLTTPMTPPSRLTSAAPVAAPSTAGRPRPAAPAGSAHAIASAPVISLPSSAPPADRTGATAPRRERGF